MIPGYGMGDAMGDPWLHSDDGHSRRIRFGTGARFEDDVRDDDTVPLRADGTALRVRWKNREDLEELQGRLVRLYVLMHQAHWYAFEFGN